MRTVVSAFASMLRWDVKYYTQPKYRWRAAETGTFADAATRRVEVIPESERASVELISIHFDGSMTRRAVNPSSVKGKLFAAYAGDLVFSKIDARNGAISVVPADWGRVAITAEFPVYEFRSKGRLLAPFVTLLSRTGAFKAKVNSFVVGHSGRKRLSPEDMEALEIPLPTIDEQQRILERAEEYRKKAADTRAAATMLQDAIPTMVLAELGIAVPHFRRLKFPFAASFGALDRWSVTRAMMKVQGVSEEISSVYAVRLLGDPELSEVSYGIQKCPSNRPGRHARPYLRVANVQNTELDLREVKFIDVPDEQMKAFELKEGDLLLCEGNSEELVGRPAIWRSQIPNCVHQNHVIKVRLNRDLLEPDYVLAYMNTLPARFYFLGRAKRTTNLASINSTDVREMPIPVPPKNIQRTIIERIEASRREARTQNEAASSSEEQAKVEVESLLFEANR